MKFKDLSELDVTASSSATVEGYDHAVTDLFHFRNPFPVLSAALEKDSDFVMGHVFIGYMDLMSTDRDYMSSARQQWQAISRALGKGLAVTAREQMHIAAFEAWLTGQMRETARILDQLLDSYPHDMLALFIGHQIDFYLGDADNLQHRIERALPYWDEDQPAYSFLLGMLAFGLEEAHDYKRAEEVGMRSVERNPDDVWGLHAVAHALEMLGEFDKGDAFMQKYRQNWTQNNFFVSHNAIHNALFKLEQNDIDGVVGLYDDFIFGKDEKPVVLGMVDASSALWRLYLEKLDLGDRWSVLADGWRPKAFQAHYTFNDMHAMMAFVGNGSDADAQKLIGTLEDYLVEDSNASDTNYAITRDVGLPICRAIHSFGHGDYNSVVDTLMPIRARVHEFGGSHTQRDAVERTLLEASLRSGRTTVAEALIAERLRECPNSTYSLGKQGELAAMQRPS